jgi:hypothetical protein
MLDLRGLSPSDRNISRDYIGVDVENTQASGSFREPVFFLKMI